MEFEEADVDAAPSYLTNLHLEDEVSMYDTEKAVVAAQVELLDRMKLMFIKNEKDFAAAQAQYISCRRLHLVKKAANKPAGYRAKTFMDLPQELRDAIYMDILIYDTPLGVCASGVAPPALGDFVYMPPMALVCRSLQDYVMEFYYSHNIFTPRSSMKPIKHPGRLWFMLTRWRALLGTDIEHLRRIELSHCFFITLSPDRLDYRLHNAHLHCRHHIEVSATNEISAKRMICKLKDDAERGVTNDNRGFCTCDLQAPLQNFARNSTCRLGSLLLEVAEHILQAADVHVTAIDCTECGKARLASVSTTDTQKIYDESNVLHREMSREGAWVTAWWFEDWG